MFEELSIDCGRRAVASMIKKAQLPPTSALDSQGTPGPSGWVCSAELGHFSSLAPQAHRASWSSHSPRGLWDQPCPAGICFRDLRMEHSPGPVDRHTHTHRSKNCFVQERHRRIYNQIPRSAAWSMKRGHVLLLLQLGHLSKKSQGPPSK